MRRARVVALLGLGFVVALFACTGEDPLPFTNTGVEAGAAADGSGALDAGTDPPADAGEGGAAEDGAAEDGDADVADAGPPIWLEPADAGAGSSIATRSLGPCSFSLVSRQLSSGPPSWTLVLAKTDAPAQTCDEPKGERILVGQAYSEAPTGDVLVRVGSPPAIVVAYNAQESPSGSAARILFMKQVDPLSGRDMRVALMKTKAVLGEPMHPSLVFSRVFFGDPTEAAEGTVRLKGTGSFPGETGTGAYFLATYVSFIGTVPQPAVAADSCERRDD